MVFPDPVALVDVGSETFALQLNGVDADVDQNLRPIVCAQADGVEGRRDKHDEAVDGRGEVARDRGDRKAWAHVLACEYGVRYVSSTGRHCLELGTLWFAHRTARQLEISNQLGQAGTQRSFNVSVNLSCRPGQLP